MREQISHQCAAGESAVASFGMFIPIEVTYAPESPEEAPIFPQGKRRRPISSRTVELIHFYDGGTWNTLDREMKLTEKQEAIADFLRSCLGSGTNTCEALRRAWLTQR